MSAAEILKELPKLTEAERRAVRQKLLELAQVNEAVALCDQAALEGAKDVRPDGGRGCPQSIPVKSGRWDDRKI